MEFSRNFKERSHQDRFALHIAVLLNVVDDFLDKCDLQRFLVDELGKRPHMAASGLLPHEALSPNIVQAYYTVFYQYIPLLYAVTWVAFSFTELIVSISSLPVLPSNRRVNRMGWSKGGFINTALLST